MNHWRSKAGALSVLALTLGTVSAQVALVAPAQAVPSATGDAAAALPTAGRVVGFTGATETASFPAATGPTGPWAALGDSLSANGVGAVRPDGTLDMLAGGQPTVLTPPASVTGQPTVSLSVGGARAVWSANADGTVSKWGGSRGSIPDRTWTEAELGGRAVQVAGGTHRAYAVVVTDTGERQVRVLAYGTDLLGGRPEGVYPIVSNATGETLTGVTSIGTANRSLQGLFPSNTVALRDDGSMVVISDGYGWFTIRPAGADPILAISTKPGDPLAGATGATGTYVTASGKAFGFAIDFPGAGTDPWALNSWQDDNYPSLPAGETIKEVNTTGDVRLGSPQYALTNQGHVVAWNSEPQAGGGPGAAVPLPASLQGGNVLDISSGAFAIVGQAPPAALAVTTAASVAGTAEVGQTLTGTPAVFNDATAVVTNRWLADGIPISGATGTTLALTAAQQGATITFSSTATRGGDTLVSTSTGVGPVAAAPVTPPPTPPAPPAPPAAPVKVNPAGGAVKLTKKPTSRKAGKATLIVTSSTPGIAAPSGTVRVTITKGRTKRTVSVTISGGRATVKLPKLARGTWKITLAYLGDSLYNPLTSGATKVKVA